MLPGLPRLFFPDQPAVPPSGPAAGPGSISPPGAADAKPGAEPRAAPWQPAPPAAGRTQPPAPPTDPPRRELRQRAAAGAIFGLLSLLALSAVNQAGHAVYLVVFAVAVGGAGCVLGISSARRARRENTTRPRGAVAAMVLGTIAIVLSLLAFFVIIFARQLNSYERCMTGARSTAQQQVCTDRLLHSVESGNAPGH
jgi:multisubunit Na+/H+ antiporter MnhC subunit